MERGRVGLGRGAPRRLTERTFFRYFRDKPEVLFHGQEPFLAAFLSGLAAAPDSASPMQLVRAALLSGTAAFDVERRPFSRQRQAVIDAHPALQERERHKLAGLADALADALRARGVTALTATLAAESGATVFAVAFSQWLAAEDDRPLAEVVGQVLDELLALSRSRP